MRDLITKRSCLLKDLLVVLAALKSNIYTAFCYTLEMHFWAPSSHLLCWQESFDATLRCNHSKTWKPGWLSLAIKQEILPVYGVLEAGKYMKTSQKLVCSAYLLLSPHVSQEFALRAGFLDVLQAVKVGVYILSVSWLLPDWGSCQISKLIQHSLAFIFTVKKKKKNVKGDVSSSNLFSLTWNL